jgi:hypothetical protein
MELDGDAVNNEQLTINGKKNHVLTSSTAIKLLWRRTLVRQPISQQ